MESEIESKQKLLKFFKALGDETRLGIVEYLLHEEWFACDFANMISKDQTTISRHLKVLVQAEILTSERKGRNIVYRIKDDEMKRRLLKLGLKPNASDCCKNGV